MGTPQESGDKSGKTDKSEPERPVDTIRRMNPGRFIPTGAELAEILKAREDDKDQKG